MNTKSFIIPSVLLLSSFYLNGCQAGLSQVSKKKAPRQNATVILDGQPIGVYWDDGDTFEFRENGRKTRARLKGFNTLESYGPVHSWGTWTRNELYEIAFKATAHAKSQQWTCNRTQSSGGYGRILVDCPDLRKSLLGLGFAHVFWMNEPAPDQIVLPQTQAIQEGIGMWAKGSPDWILTSLHSSSEDNLPVPYNRMVSTRTGEAKASQHSKRYQTCQQVCESGSCMIYVPYRIRYGKNRPNCLKVQ